MDDLVTTRGNGTWKVPGEKTIAHTACRVGKGPPHGISSTRDLSFFKSHFCRCSSMSVIIFWFRTYADFYSGRDHDYQTLNLTVAVNVMKFGSILSMFPRPFKPYVVTSICTPLLLRRTLGSLHACYRTFPYRFNKKLNLSDLWLKSDLRRWSMERTGMINRFVRPLYLVSLSLHR